MKIVMFTNDYLPQVGGVAQSVHRFSEVYRSQGHDVLVIAPEYKGASEHEDGVHRIPAIPEFNDSDFSLALPVGFDLIERLDAFQPSVIHAHHPFLLGNTAARAAAQRRLPLVFTHHTRYEYYTHYAPVQLEAMSDYIARLATGFANLCETVIAPSSSIADLLAERGVTSPIEVIPTGVDIDHFTDGDGRAFRERFRIAPETTLIGHCGRLAPEKNLPFLAQAVCQAMQQQEGVAFLVVGSGPSQETIEQTFHQAGLEERLYMAGTQTGQDLVDAYHAMDLFAFASKTETQGMVLTEALSAGCPLVALDAPGSREVVEDRVNGRLIAEEDRNVFADGIADVVALLADEQSGLRERARRSAEPFDQTRCAGRALDVYEDVVGREPQQLKVLESGEWADLLRSLQREWDLWSNRFSSFSQAVFGSESHRRGKRPADTNHEGNSNSEGEGNEKP